MKSILITIALLVIAGCGFTKNTGSLDGLKIQPQDWNVSNRKLGEVSAVVKDLKPEKLSLLQTSFRTPEIEPVEIQNGSNYELFQMKGYSDYEDKVFVLPKIFVSTGTQSGSILGYRTGKSTLDGDDFIEISIPIALTNGFENQIGVSGSSGVGKGDIVTLPDSHQISNLSEIQKRTGKKLATLPVCPKYFKLKFENRELQSKNPYDGLAHCPTNRFFRITFQTSAKEMKRLLDLAALKDDAVTLSAQFETNFRFPIKSVEVSTTSKHFEAEFLSVLSNTQKISGYDNHYSIASIEEAIDGTLRKISKSIDLDYFSGNGSSAVFSAISNEYFGPIETCGGNLSCRKFTKKSSPTSSKQWSWMQGDSFAKALTFESYSSLGAVANSSQFIAMPSSSQLERITLPKFFIEKTPAQVIPICEKLNKENFKSIADENKEKQLVISVCNLLLEHKSTFQEDGYRPLGNNTTVFPGAWLKIDLESVEEFSSAKTKTKKDGSVVVESEVIDLISSQGKERAVCVEGHLTACSEYKYKKELVRDNEGNPILTSGKFTYQDVLDYTCDPKDEVTYCPYTRTEERVIDYEIEYDCKDILIQEDCGFLRSCEQVHQLQCKEKSKKPVKAIRKVLNCIEDEDERASEISYQSVKLKIPFERKATAHRIKSCKHPKYTCSNWNKACTRYSINESYHIIHEELFPRWRPFSISNGEYPSRFLEDTFLRFESPGGISANNCRLSDFPREFRGNSIFIKIPESDNKNNPCDSKIWTDENLVSSKHPRVFIKNAISHSAERACGRSEHSYIANEIPIHAGTEILPLSFSYLMKAHFGPLTEYCHAQFPYQVGHDLWFKERPPVRFNGRVSVLGKMMESIVSGVQR